MRLFPKIECILSDDFFDIKRIFTNECILNSDFVFIMMNKFKNPFDYCAFNKSTKRFLCVATNVESGRPQYFEKLNKSYNEGYEKVIKRAREIQLFLNG